MLAHFHLFLLTGVNRMTLSPLEANLSESNSFFLAKAVFSEQLFYCFLISLSFQREWAEAEILLCTQDLITVVFSSFKIYLLVLGPWRSAASWFHTLLHSHESWNSFSDNWGCHLIMYTLLWNEKQNLKNWQYRKFLNGWPHPASAEASKKSQCFISLKFRSQLKNPWWGIHFIS